MTLKAVHIFGGKKMSQQIKGTDGKVYKQVLSGTNRKRTLEIIFGVISLIVSIISLASGFGIAALGDAFGGGGYFTMRLLLSVLLSIVAFILVFFINKKHSLISWSIIILGAIILFSAGDFGIAGGVLFLITGFISLFRK